MNFVPDIQVLVNPVPNVLAILRGGTRRIFELEWMSKSVDSGLYSTINV